jgi:hypothetical protein
MINLAIGLGGFVVAVLFLRNVAYRWMEKERKYRHNERSTELAAIITSRTEGQFAEGEIVKIERVVAAR